MTRTLRFATFFVFVALLAVVLTGCGKKDEISPQDAQFKAMEMVRAKWVGAPVKLSEEYSQVLDYPPGVKTVCGHYLVNGKSRFFFAVAYFEFEKGMTPYYLDQAGGHPEMFCQKGNVVAWTK